MGKTKAPIVASVVLLMIAITTNVFAQTDRFIVIVEIVYGKRFYESVHEFTPNLLVSVAGQQQYVEVTEGDERPLDDRRANPIVEVERVFEFPEGQIAEGRVFQVCIKSLDPVYTYLDECKTLKNSRAEKPEKASFNIN
jgi:hypothetical protein